MSDQVAVFFYGLFMDPLLLASRGMSHSPGTIGHIEGYAIRIGARATLVQERGSQAYGLVVRMKPEDVKALYSDVRVADYIAESVTVVLPDGSLESAVCYNLPEHKLGGTNAEYARSLLSLAVELGFPDPYIEEIRRQAS